MIFVTVGTQLPFERLIKAMDQWAGEHPETKVFGQIGQTQYRPVNFEYVIMLTPNEYENVLSEATVIVGHVGMGTIITGIERNKSLVLMPRHADKGEHRNDHQLSTASRFKQLKAIDIVDTDEELSAALNSRLSSGSGASELSKPSPTLIKTLADFVAAVK
jgi:UDP-N-acetylglucosamine transferase subunit ALG13